MMNSNSCKQVVVSLFLTPVLCFVCIQGAAQKKAVFVDALKIPDSKFDPSGTTRAAISSLHCLSTDKSGSHKVVLVSDNKFLIVSTVEIKKGKLSITFDRNEKIGIWNGGAEAVTMLPNKYLLISFEAEEGFPSRVNTYQNLGRNTLVQKQNKLTKKLTKASSMLDGNRGLETLVALPDGKVLAIAERMPNKPRAKGFDENETKNEHTQTPLWIVSRDMKMKRMSYPRFSSGVKKKLSGKKEPVILNYTVKDAAVMPRSGDVLVLEHNGAVEPGETLRRERIVVRRVKQHLLLKGFARTEQNEALTVLDIDSAKKRDPMSKYADAFEGIAVLPCDEHSSYVLLAADNESGHRRETKFLLFKLTDKTAK